MILDSFFTLRNPNTRASSALAIKWLCFSVLLGSSLGQCATLYGQHAAITPGAAVPENTLSSIELLIRNHEYESALRISKNALQQRPKDFRVWSLTGIIFSLERKNNDAIDAFDHAIKFSPNYIVALRGEVQLYYQTHNKRAIPLLERILRIDPSDFTAREMLAMLYGSTGNCEAANHQFSLISSIMENHPESLEEYGNCLVQTDQLDKATAVFEQLSRLIPERTYPKYDLAVVLVEAKQNEAAIKVLDPLITSNPNDADILSLASEAYEAIGDTPKAVALLRQAIVINPTNADYYNSFAALCLSHESYQVGIDMMHAGIQRISNDPSLYLSLGLLYAQLAQYDEAESAFRTAERMDSTQSISSYALDLTEIQKNNSGKAVAQIRSQLKLHPDSALLHYLFAKLVFSEGNEIDSPLSKEALQSALTAVKLNPNLVEARDLLATMYTNTNQYGLAVEQSRLALKTNPDDQTAIYHLIVALRHSSKPADRAESAALVTRLAELQKKGRQDETNRKRFKFIEQKSLPLSQ